MTQPLRIVFAGTPDFAVPTLQALLDSVHSVVAVYSQPDRPAGRGRKLSVSPVKALAVQAGLPVVQPVNFKDPAAITQLAAWQPDLLIVVAYGLLLPTKVLAIPRLGCLNIHASLLPRWRGAAPIQRAVLAGDSETGVAIMHMEAGLDTGPVYLSRRLPISSSDTAGDLHDRLATLGSAALLEALPGIIDGTSSAIPQSTHGSLYAHRLDKAEAWIDWHQSAVQIACQVRAFNPWPVAQSTLRDKRLRIWQAEALPDAICAVDPGTIIAANPAGIDVVTGSGVLRLSALQLPGKRVTSARDFVNAQDVLGMRLGS